MPERGGAPGRASRRRGAAARADRAACSSEGSRTSRAGRSRCGCRGGRCGGSAPGLRSRSRSHDLRLLPADRDARVDRARRVVHGRRVGRTTISSPCSSCCSANASAAARAAPHAPAALRAPPRPNRRNGLLRARRNIAYHYDLGNELFALMLDETMTYSCADLRGRADEPLADAQRRKLRRVCDKLELGPDDRVLEIGCGWGSFAILAASERGCRVTGLTISPRPGSPRPRAGSRGRRSATWSRSARRTTAPHRGTLHEGGLDRDARGDRRAAVRAPTSPPSTACSSPAARLRSDDPRARRPLGALPPQARLDRALRLPRLPDPVALGASAAACRRPLTADDPRGSRRSAPATPRRSGAGARASRAASRRSARSATTAASSAPGTSISPTARPRSGRGRSATCSSRSAARTPREGPSALRRRRCRLIPGRHVQVGPYAVSRGEQEDADADAAAQGAGAPTPRHEEVGLPPVVGHSALGVVRGRRRRRRSRDRDRRARLERRRRRKQREREGADACGRLHVPRRPAEPAAQGHDATTTPTSRRSRARSTRASGAPRLPPAARTTASGPSGASTGHRSTPVRSSTTRSTARSCIWWGPKVPDSTVNQLAKFYDQQSDGMFGTPYAGLGNKIALTAWTGDPTRYYQQRLLRHRPHRRLPEPSTRRRSPPSATAYRGKGPEGIPLEQRPAGNRVPRVRRFLESLGSQRVPSNP